MEALFVPTENDFKKWIREAVQECVRDLMMNKKEPVAENDQFLNRKEIAAYLRISLVTLNDWVSRGLPSHKQRGRVYFDKQEVKQYIKDHKIGGLIFGSRFRKIKQEVG